MQMIDILTRLKQIQESNPNLNVGDAIANVERTNGAVDEKAKNPYAVGMAAAMKATGDKPPLEKSTITKAHDIAKSIEKNEGEMDESMSRQHFQYVADLLKDIEDPIKRAEYAQHHSTIFQHFNPRFDHAKFMAAAGVNEAVEEGRVKSWLMDMESDAVDMTREAFIKKHGQSQVHVWDRVHKQEKENEGKEMKKDKINESVVIATDNPEEASMMMQLLKLAGVKPVDQAMINPSEVKADETYANEPDEKVQSVNDLVNTNSGGLNKQKIQANPNNPADNPLAMGKLGKPSAPAVNIGEGEITEEQLSNSLRNQYESFKQTYQEAAKAKPDYLDFDKDGNKEEPMKKALKDLKDKK
jgi:hypothetical protein